jgi:hypothetical protein
MKTKNRKKESPNYRDVSISIGENSIEIRLVFISFHWSKVKK